MSSAAKIRARRSPKRVHVVTLEVTTTLTASKLRKRLRALIAAGALNDPGDEAAGDGATLNQVQSNTIRREHPKQSTFGGAS